MTRARMEPHLATERLQSAKATLGSDPGFDPCQIWGVLNVTPDSFSDGGRFLQRDAALSHARQLLEAGADVLDVGGASSRPAGRDYGGGAPVISASEELSRIMPVMEALRAELPQAAVSIDTTQAEVARAALAAGAFAINDVSCAANQALLAVTAEAGADYVLMHNRGDGRTAGEHIRYQDVVEDVCIELGQAVDRAVAAGIPRERIWLDPGLGFAKTSTQSLALLAATARLCDLGHRLLVGPSRKGFLAEVGTPAGQLPPAPNERDAGTAAAVTLAALAGAHAVRVHDVRGAYQASRLVAAVRKSRREHHD